MLLNLLFSVIGFKFQEYGRQGMAVRNELKSKLLGSYLSLLQRQKLAVNHFANKVILLSRE